PPLDLGAREPADGAFDLDEAKGHGRGAAAPARRGRPGRAPTIGTAPDPRRSPETGSAPRGNDEARGPREAPRGGRDERDGEPPPVLEGAHVLDLVLLAAAVARAAASGDAGGAPGEARDPRAPGSP